MRRRSGHKLRPSLVALVAICGLVVAPLQPATAQPQAQADRMKEVKKACAAGDFDRGVRLLADLYAETNDPTAIYNQGRCYQQNAEPERAAARFREYLRKAKDLSPADRAEVEGFIREADAEAAVRAQRAAQPAPAAPAPPPPQWTAPAPTYAPAPVYAPLPPPAPVRTSRRKGLMIAGFITLGVSYVLTLLVGAAIKEDKDCGNCTEVGEAFYVPIIGPWTVYNDEAKPGDYDLLTMSKRKDLNGVALVAGVTQGIGTVLSAIGVAVFVASGKPKPVAAIPTFVALPGGGIGGLRGSF
jgi:hypothetical protein